MPRSIWFVAPLLIAAASCHTNGESSPAATGEGTLAPTSSASTAPPTTDTPADPSSSSVAPSTTAAAPPAEVATPCEPARRSAVAPGDAWGPWPDHYITYSRTRVWSVAPVRCDPSTTSASAAIEVAADTLNLTGTAIADPADVVTLRVPYRDLAAAVPFSYPTADVSVLNVFGNLALLGVTDDAGYWRTENAAIRLDLDTGQIAALPFVGGGGDYMTPVGLIGDTVLVDGGESWWRVDFGTRTLVPLGAPAERCGRSLLSGAVPNPEQVGTALVVTPREEVWCTERESRDNPGHTVATRMAADGSVVTSPPIGGSGFVFAGGGSLWMFASLPGEGITTPLHPARVDPETGRFLVVLDAPAESFPPGIGFGGAHVNSDGMLALSDRDRAWWVTNEGELERLAPMDFDVVGVTESHYVAVRDDGTAVAGELASLPRATPSAP